MTRDFSFSPHEAFHGADHNVAFLKMREREERRSYTMLMPVSKSHTITSFSIHRSKSLGPGQTQGLGAREKGIMA